MLILQSNNDVPVAAACYLVSCTLCCFKLSRLHIDHEPSVCVGNDAWHSEGLPVPPREVVAAGWKSVLRLLRVRRI